MTGKQLKMIFGTLGVLVLVYAVVRLIGASSGAPTSGGLAIGSSVDSSASLVRVLGPAPGDSLHLQRTASGSWNVNGHPAKSDDAAELVAALDTASARRLVSRNPANHARLGLTEDSARRVSIGPAAEPSVRFLLGKSGSGGYFVRDSGAAESYLLDGPAGRLLSRGLDEWRNRVIASLDTAQVGRVAIRRDGDTLELSRASGRWTLGGQPADSARAGQLLRLLSRMTASGFPSDSAVAAADFQHPDAEVVVYGRPTASGSFGEAGADSASAAGAGKALLDLTVVRTKPSPEAKAGAMRGGATKEAALVREQGSPETYELPAWTLRQLLPTRQQMEAGPRKPAG